MSNQTDFWREYTILRVLQYERFKLPESTQVGPTNGDGGKPDR